MHYQAYDSPCVLAGDEFMHLRPEKSGKDDTRREQANENQQILPIERSHQLEFRELDTVLKKLMKLFCVHAATISIGIR